MGAAAVRNMGGFQPDGRRTDKFRVLRRRRGQRVLPAQRLKFCVRIRWLLLRLGGQWLAVRHGLLWSLVSITFDQRPATAARIWAAAADLSLPTLFLLVEIQSGAMVSGEPSPLVVSASSGHGALPDMAISRDSFVPGQAVLSRTYAPDIPPSVSSSADCRAGDTGPDNPPRGSSSIQARISTGRKSCFPPTCAPSACATFRATAHSAPTPNLSSGSTTTVSPGSSSSASTPRNPLGAAE